jgi:diguanylate cyclase (GGDEF)-like protein
LIGVLTLYSVDADAFNEDHRRILEVVGRQVAHTVRQALTFERYRATDLRDTETGLPNVRHLERMFAAASTNVQPEDKVSVIFVTIRQEIGRHGNDVHTLNDRTIERVTCGIRKALRGGDLLFRYDGNELAVLLSQTDAETASLVAERTRLALVSELSKGPVDAWPVGVSLGVATAPADGVSVEELIKAARNRERPIASGPSHSAIH